MRVLYANTREGIFLRRPNRFIAHVLLDGEETVCHVKNTGRCRDLLLPGARVILARGMAPGRKTLWDLVAVRKGDMLVNIDSQAPNRVVLPYLKERFPGATVRPEVCLGQSRLDFLVEQGQARLYIEVKGVTLEQDGLAMFPDAPTQRGTRHLNELARLCRMGHQAMVLFVAQMRPVAAFVPNRDMDPAFAEALEAAAAQGVKIEALDCLVTPDGMQVHEPVPVLL